MRILLALLSVVAVVALTGCASSRQGAPLTSAGGPADNYGVSHGSGSYSTPNTYWAILSSPGQFD
jgi:hypothetical protein